MLTSKDLIEAAAFIDECPTDQGVMDTVALIAQSDAAETVGPFLAEPSDESQGISHNETVIGLCLAAAALD